MDDYITNKESENRAMKVGILSMQRVKNYGSFLQAYALKETLNDLGHESFFIDIKPGRQLTGGSDVSNEKKESKINYIVKRLDRNLFKRAKQYYLRKKRISRFNDEFFPILGVSKEPVYYSDYDVIVIGSDEVFNCATKSPWGFAKTLFGEGLNSNKIITYAASCGHTTLEDVEKYGIKDEIASAMENLEAISVRDNNTKKFVSELTKKETFDHIDPTLIYNFDKLLVKGLPENNYILIYGYDGRINDKKIIKKVMEFAKKEKKEVICAGVFQSWCDRHISCTPFELLSYFKNADYIITDTFHGTVFSVKYNKQFVTLVRESNKQKVTDLLEKFELTDRIIYFANEIEKKLKTDILYHCTNKTIKDYQESAMNYFNCYLNK